MVTRSTRIRFLRETGDVQGALRRLREVLPDQERVLGVDHLDVLLTRQELARTLGRAGQVADALTQMAQVQADQERVLGHSHPQVLSTRYERAVLTGQIGDAAEAVRQARAGGREWTMSRPATQRSKVIRIHRYGFCKSIELSHPPPAPCCPSLR